MSTIVTSAGVLGRAIRDARRGAGLSQSDLAARVGLSQVGVSRIERAAERAPLATVLSLLAVLDLELSLHRRPVEDPPSPWES
ncbi:MAG: helix-turn-helix domain-containing protein [bacterium]|nr:helix-turn-helix domain-containing protein [bacterium]